MLSKRDIKDYAVKICVPLMERNLRRMQNGDWGFKPDQVGYVPTFLENFCRPFWGITPILADGEEIFLDVNGEKITVFEYMRTVLNKGLSHGEEYSWDTHKDIMNMNPYCYENQNITELAGLMVGIYFAKDQLWEPLSEYEKEMYAKELYEMAEIAYDNSWPNNHYWFPLFVFTVLKRFGYNFERLDEMIDGGLAFLNGLYLSDGWFVDGAFGRFDYYEAWALHMYPLLWTLIADESFNNYEEHKKKFVSRTNEFIEYFTHWFDANGANVAFGRSLTYRFAACSLFPVAVLAGCDVNPSLAGRITAKNIEFFKNNVRNEESDILPEGYLYHAPAIVEGYTSDGGAYWCCKAFFALLIDDNHPFWDYDKALLPSEKDDFLVDAKHKDINLIFEGHNGIVNLFSNTAYTTGKRPFSFGNERSWYSKFVYNSAVGFGCSVIEKMSVDSMISLVTEDETMCSHRLAFENLGVENGILHSRHIPFTNDKESSIESWILPMGEYHIRIHKVKLSSEYYVKEGGFSVGSWDDYRPSKFGGNTASVENYDYISVMKSVSTAEIEMNYEDTQANFHLYAPLAGYPIYKTKEVLKPGEYIFASAFAVKKVDDNIILPDIVIKDGRVEIIGKEKNIFVEIK